MEEFASVSVRVDQSPELATRIAAFRRRAGDLVEFIRSIRWGQHHVSIDRDDENRPRIRGSLPDELILEELYRRYRFFILNNENSNYRRLVKLLPQHSDSELLALYSRMARKEFLQEEILKFAFITARDPVNPEELMDYWFNAYYFHDDEEKIARLVAVKQTVSENGAKVALWHVVWNSSLRVRTLAYLLRETGEKHPYMYVPQLCKLYG